MSSKRRILETFLSAADWAVYAPEPVAITTRGEQPLRTLCREVVHVWSLRQMEPQMNAAGSSVGVRGCG
jgi:hypothetical protein